MPETREPVESAKDDAPGAPGQRSTDEQPYVRLDWSAADDAPIQQANVVQVQFMGADMVLTLGVVVPPIAMAGMTPEQIAEYLNENSVPVKQAVKILLSKEATGVLARHLQLASSPAPAEESQS